MTFGEFVTDVIGAWLCVMLTVLGVLFIGLVVGWFTNGENE